MGNIKILWVDDEIDLLKPHIMFLNKKNYDVVTCDSGMEALEIIEEQGFDIVFLDENMPGLSGIDTLTALKAKKGNLPVVMITKSEEEYIMEEAIGSKIADYLIKPVNPNQILLSLKKNLDHARLVSEHTTTKYQQAFRQLSMDMLQLNSADEWIDFYRQLLFWERELDILDDTSMAEILETQKKEANAAFFKFISKNYASWFDNNTENAPVLSHQLFKNKILQELQYQSTLLVVVDNLRYDQFMTIEKSINKHYKKDKEEAFYSILPTATQYARNAIFSGLMPLDMQKLYPGLWLNDTDEGGKNMHEKDFLNHQLTRLGLEIDYSYHKITSLEAGRQLADKFSQYKDKDLTVVVYNFVDMLSHAKTEMQMIKELASTDKSYRSLTLSWFENSPLLDIITMAQKLGMKLILTTDHGTINVKNPSKVIGDKNTSTNLRYKTGKSLTYNHKEVYSIKNPSSVRLPSIHMSSSFIFAKNDYFLAYPNNYNYYVSYYKNTFQHGGISLEEMIIPFAVFLPKE